MLLSSQTHPYRRLGVGGEGEASFFYPTNTSGTLNCGKVALASLRSLSISRMNSLICFTYKPSWRGKYRATGSGFGTPVNIKKKKKKFVANSQSGPAKTLYTKSVRLVLSSRVTGPSLKGLLCIFGELCYYRGQTHQ